MYQIAFKNGYGVKSKALRDTKQKAEKLAEAYQSAGFKDVVVSVVEDEMAL